MHKCAFYGSLYISTNGAVQKNGEQPLFVCFLVMEESHSRERHSDAVLVAGLDDLIVTNGSAGLTNIGHAAPARALYIVTEREECIRCECHSGDGREICALLLAGEGLGASGEVVLPYVITENVLGIVRDIYIDTVISVGSAESRKEGQIL